MGVDFLNKYKIKNNLKKEKVMNEEIKEETLKIDMTNTKKEMLNAYNTMLNKIKSQNELDLNPKKRAAEKEVKATVSKADSLSTEQITKSILTLKTDFNKTLNSLSDKLENEVSAYEAVIKAIVIKENELAEIFEIEKEAASLAALIEAQSDRKREFSEKLEKEKEDLATEVEEKRIAWNEEKKQHGDEQKERQETETKVRNREKEEYKYELERERKLARDSFEDEKNKLERDISEKRNSVNKELGEREKAVFEREENIEVMHTEIDSFPEKLSNSIKKAVNEVTEKLKSEAGNNQKLQQKDFEAERNTFVAEAASLKMTVETQKQQIKDLTAKLDKSYDEVKDMAVKTIEGISSNTNVNAELRAAIASKNKEKSSE